MFSCYLLQHRVLKHSGLGWFVTKQSVGGPQGRIRRHHNTYNKWQRESFYKFYLFPFKPTFSKFLRVIAEMLRSSFGLKYSSCRTWSFMKMWYLRLLRLCGKLILREGASALALHHSDDSFSRNLRFTLLTKNKITSPAKKLACLEQDVMRPGQNQRGRDETRAWNTRWEETKIIYFTTFFSFPLALRDRSMSYALHGFIVRCYERLFCRR